MKIKTLAAVLGGSAMIGLGAAGVLIGGGVGSAAPVMLSVGEMTMGDTATADYTETSVPTSVAVPGDKASPPCGFSSGC